MPRVADPNVREALIEHAARIVAEEGRPALTLRRLATEVGTSTMAVYTHFGSMDELRRAVRLEGFARLRARLAEAEHSDDALADLYALGQAYFHAATDSPNLYRAMFLDRPAPGEEPHVGLDTFVTLVDGLDRCVREGVFPGMHPTDPADMAVEVWALTHGLLSLQLAQLLPAEQVGARFRSAAAGLFRGWGADPDRLRGVGATSA